MATSEIDDIPSNFPGIPPFPSNVPTAPLLRISLAKLLQGDVAEEDRLWEACCDLGFFYLDLRAHEGVAGAQKGSVNGTQLLKDADELFEVEKEFFDLPVEEKLKYDLTERGLYHGYKGYGVASIDVQGNKDRNEFYNISKDDILSVIPPLPSPAVLSPHRPLITSFINNSHALTLLVLSILNRRLGLPENTLSDLHRLHAPAGDQIRFIKAPPQPVEDRQISLGSHTDFGSVTVLFNRLGGLEVMLPAYVKPILPKSESTNGNGAGDGAEQGAADEEKEKEKVGTDASGENWAYVRPLPSHAIVNLGDAMVKFTAGVLRSNIHRVVNPPGAQADSTRYSLVYFSRPEDDVILKTLKGSAVIDEQAKRLGVDRENEEEVTAEKWINRRAMARRTGKWEDYGGTEDAVMRRDSAQGGVKVAAGGS